MAANDTEWQTACLRELYNAYRTALMNRKYYGARLDAAKRVTRLCDAIVALATSGAIGAWAIWRTGVGETVWAFIAGAAAIVAVVKPFLPAVQNFERYTRLFTSHGDAYFDLDVLANRVRRERNYSPEADESYRQVADRIRQLAPEDDPRPSKTLLRDCYEEVLSEIPAAHLWLPTAAVKETP